MTTPLWALAACYILAGSFCAGLFVGEHPRRWNEPGIQGFVMFCVILWPIGLIVLVLIAFGAMGKRVHDALTKP